MKTAEQLNLPADQYNALVKTLEFLESGKVTHIHGGQAAGIDIPLGTDAVPIYFSMNWWYGAAQHDCGTVACIGGTAELLSGVKFSGELDEELFKLFYPDSGDLELAPVYNDITVEQATKTLRDYLETGDVDWSHALPSEF